MAQASPKIMQSLKSMPVCLGLACGLSAHVSLNCQTSGILTPDQTGIYIETLLQSYKAELRNKKYTFGFALNTQVSLRKS